MSKEDPLDQEQKHSYRGRTLWLDRENMVEARENFWRRYNQINPTAVGNLDDHHIWEVSWAAAVAAVDYVMSGRVEP
jgi:hypothetical protein